MRNVHELGDAVGVCGDLLFSQLSPTQRAALFARHDAHRGVQLRIFQSLVEAIPVDASPRIGALQREPRFVHRSKLPVHVTHRKTMRGHW